MFGLPRPCFRRRASAARPVAALLLCAGAAWGQFQLETDYANPHRMAPPDSGSARATAAFGGSAEPAATNSLYRLEQSAFAQPATGIRPDFRFGEEIPIPPDAATNESPVVSISPSTGAVYLDYLGRVLATDVGVVTIVWRLDGGGVREETYLVSGAPIQPSVTLYWTHGNFKGPAVNVGTGFDVVPHYNRSIGSNDVRVLGGILATYDGVREGKFLLEYRDSAADTLIGMEVVDVRKPNPVVRDVPIGRHLGPGFNPHAPDGTTAHISRGQDGLEQKVTTLPSGPGQGVPIPVWRVENPLDLEIFWQHESTAGILWPHRVERYLTHWPGDAQVYARGHQSGDLGHTVTAPESYQIQLLPFQEPAGHAEVLGQEVRSSGPGHCLLKISALGVSWIEPIRSVDHRDAAVFDLSPQAVDIGRVIQPEDPEAQLRPGYIHASEGDAYHPFLYQGAEAPVSDIFAVNAGVLEVWWLTPFAQPGMPEPIYWTDVVRRYDCRWPTNAPEIVIASNLGGAEDLPDEYVAPLLYAQNDPDLPGYNPNEEHAMLLGDVPFALRTELNEWAGHSEPYVLVEHFDSDGHPRMALWRVLETNETWRFEYDVVAGKPIVPPLPLPVLPHAQESYGSGPVFFDRKNAPWAMAAGNDGGAAEIDAHFFYPNQTSFAYPGFDAVVAEGAPIPFLQPMDFDPFPVTYTVTWPTNAPVLHVNESLVKPKNGLPAIAGQISVDVLYQQSAAIDGSDSVVLIDPTVKRSVAMETLPTDLGTDSFNGKTLFPQLPPHLRDRLHHDPTADELVLVGEFREPPAGESYLLLNVLSDADRQVVNDLSADSANWDDIVAGLAVAPVTIAGNDVFDSLALSAGVGGGTGYVTLAFANNPLLAAPADPVSLEVIRVELPTYRGEIKVVESGNPFDEQITLMHSGDFAGEPEDFEFEWRTLPPAHNGGPPSQPPATWNHYEQGPGLPRVIVGGPGLFTLTDNFFVMRYRSTKPNDPAGGAWSPWTEPQLAEGWVKRVLAGIDPFEQRIDDLRNSSVNSQVSMISQAGARWRGNVPLNLDVVDDYGLIEIYETVLNRAQDMSIRAGVNYGPANDALLLAAGRINQLYMLLGNEAFADAADPTVALGTDDPVYGTEAASIHCFMNQVPTLLHEELALLRGRDDAQLPSVRTHPVHNRLVWNFTRDITGGEVAYALNYNIRDESGNVDGSIDEVDAARLYPQGHGDAWGHYLSAVKPYYQMLSNPAFSWVPRAETILVAGVPVSVDYLDERKFAATASARARTGLLVTQLTAREGFSESEEFEADRLVDPDPDRAWGVAEWASRAGQAALYDWALANAVLPAEDTVNTGIRKVDRGTVPELRELVSLYGEIQTAADHADGGLNPLGLARGAIPFDIDPQEIDAGKTQFEQVYDRALVALDNAVTVFNHAKASTQALRRQADTVADFQQTVAERERDFENRLIEIFGYPYADDIGPGMTYPQGYAGPDLVHYNYMDLPDLVGLEPEEILTVEHTIFDYGYDADDQEITSNNSRAVTFHVDSGTGLMIKPPEWTGERRAAGRLQEALGNVLQASVALREETARFQGVLADIESAHRRLEARARLNRRTQVKIEDFEQLSLELGATIAALKIQSKVIEQMERHFVSTMLVAKENLPRSVGSSFDPSFAARGALTGAEKAASNGMRAIVLAENAAAMALEAYVKKEGVETKIEIDLLKREHEVEKLVIDLERKVRKTFAAAVAIDKRLLDVQQTVEGYRAVLAEGERLQQERLCFRVATAADTQAHRYKDMAFRIARNDAVQKYRATFDLAARYTYLAAKAYDYETTLLSSGDDGTTGREFLSQIARARSLGRVVGGVPRIAGASGDPGLADVLARMNANWQVLDGRLGFNNPETETGRFSLRREFFRIGDGPESDALWRRTLKRHTVDNLLLDQEFAKHCIRFQPVLAEEPAIVIPFRTEVNFGKNFFGHDLAGGDNAYDSSHFSTKIRSAGVWFANYSNAGGGGLANQPRVYLVPTGRDVLRSPSGNGDQLVSWRVFDQALPLPFPIGAAELGQPDFVPLQSMQGGDEFAQRRRFASLRAYHDSGDFDPGETIGNSRLVGRSVWNDRWLLIIPAGTLFNDRDEGLARFIDGALDVDGQRDGNGVSDIKIFFQTYSYSGN